MVPAMLYGGKLVLSKWLTLTREGRRMESKYGIEYLISKCTCPILSYRLTTRERCDLPTT